MSDEHKTREYRTGSDPRTLRDALGCFATGVTVVRPHAGDLFCDRVPAAAVVKAVYALLMIAGLLLLARSLPALLSL